MAEKTEAVTIDVPEYLMIGIRKQIAEGKFATESEAIVARLEATDDFSWAPDEPFDGMTDEQWDAEIERRMASLAAGTMKTYTVEEVMQHLEETKRELQRG